MHRGGNMRSNCMTNFWLFVLPWSSTARLRRSICAQTYLHSGLDIGDGGWSALSLLSCSPFAQLTMLWKVLRA